MGISWASTRTHTHIESKEIKQIPELCAVFTLSVWQPFAFMQASLEQIWTQCNILIKRHCHVRGAESKYFAFILCGYNSGWQSAWFLSSSDYWHRCEAGPTGVNYHTISPFLAQSDYFYLGMKAPWGLSVCTSLWWALFFFWWVVALDNLPLGCVELELLSIVETDKINFRVLQVILAWK